MSRSRSEGCGSLAVCAAVGGESLEAQLECQTSAAVYKNSHQTSSSCINGRRQLSLPPPFPGAVIVGALLATRLLLAAEQNICWRRATVRAFTFHSVPLWPLLFPRAAHRALYGAFCDRNVPHIHFNLISFFQPVEAPPAGVNAVLKHWRPEALSICYMQSGFRRCSSPLLL